MKAKSQSQKSSIQKLKIIFLKVWENIFFFFALRGTMRSDLKFELSVKVTIEIFLILYFKMMLSLFVFSSWKKTIDLLVKRNFLLGCNHAKSVIMFAQNLLCVLRCFSMSFVKKTPRQIQSQDHQKINYISVRGHFYIITKDRLT